MITKKSILNLKSRQEIYKFILDNPGLHLRGISRQTNIPKSTLIYHLKHLIKRELIIQKTEHGYSRYFISKKIGTETKKILYFLRQEIPSKLLFCFLINVVSSSVEISRSLEENPTKINFHLKKLLKAGILENAPKDKGEISRPKNRGFIQKTVKTSEKFYRIKNPQKVHDAIISNRDSVVTDEILKQVFYYYEKELSYYWPLPKKLNKKDPNQYLDLIMEEIFEVFPHPYHA